MQIRKDTSTMIRFLDGKQKTNKRINPVNDKAEGDSEIWYIFDLMTVDYLDLAGSTRMCC